MKNLVFIIVLMVHFSAMGQYQYHRAITIKTNTLSLWSAALELPLLDPLTLELSYRQVTYNDFDATNSMKRYKETRRINVKYHFPRQDDLGQYYSLYIFGGLNHVVQTAEKLNVQYGKCDINRMTIGLGSKRRAVDIWLAFEKVYSTKHNIFYPNGFNSIPTVMIPNTYLSFGIAINAANILL